MKFTEMEYVRPDYETVSAQYEEHLKELEAAQDKESFMKAFKAIEELRVTIATASTLTFVRHSINTKDEFYDKENEYWDETNPLYAVYDNRLSKICVECPFRSELYDEIPQTFFLNARGEIVSKKIGALSQSALVNAIGQIRE